MSATDALAAVAHLSAAILHLTPRSSQGAVRVITAGIAIIAQEHVEVANLLSRAVEEQIHE